MKAYSLYSRCALILIAISIILISTIHFKQSRLVVTTYDALGYYMYLPSIFVYKDVKDLKWKDEIDKKYRVSGGKFYQAGLKNGSYVNKYYCGTAIMQAPFFLIADQYAKYTSHERDGFSKPYQLSVLVASIFYAMLGLFLLHLLLLKYFPDKITAITLICIILGTNIIQYISIDCGQTHSYLFFLYCLILYATQQWHQKPKLIYAALLGLALGLAVCTRPTEAIAIFIPILWLHQDKQSRQTKWNLVWSHKTHLYCVVICGIIALAPQLIYWYYTTGSLIHDVGSKWQFLNPFFRVLFGGEKGWFVYTPITLLFILSLFYVSKYEFSSSIKYFTFLNIWIVISWFEWRYGGSYSTRALSQSYPLFALSFAALLNAIKNKKIILALSFILPYLIITNLFQIYQYNKNILHYDHMNFKYYKQIYWNPDPSPLDFSLLDTKDWVKPSGVKSSVLLLETKEVNTRSPWVIASLNQLNNKKGEYLKTSIKLNLSQGYWGNHIVVTFAQSDKILKTQKLRLNHPQARVNQENTYQFFSKIPETCVDCILSLELENKTAQLKKLDLRIDKIQL